MRAKFLAGFLAPLGLAASAAAQDAPPPSPDEPRIEIVERLDLTLDLTQRMTVPVSISGQGPYSFIVDTGSERTVIARELAERLRLDPGRTATVYSMTEASRIGTVVIPQLEVGQRRINEIHAPALARHNLGAEGLLGVDSLRSQRVEFDFVRQEMTVSPSRAQAERHWPSETIVVTARRRYGQLVITDASLDGERIVAIIDSGAQVSVGNRALQRRLDRRNRLGPLRQIELISVTGGRIAADYGPARRIQIGGAVISDLPIAFADVHPFRQFRLSNRPAILLGMDALQLFERVAVDFGNRRVQLLIPGGSELGPRWRLADLTAARPGRSAVERPAAP